MSGELLEWCLLVDGLLLFSSLVRWWELTLDPPAAPASRPIPPRWVREQQLVEELRTERLSLQVDERLSLDAWAARHRAQYEESEAALDAQRRLAVVAARHGRASEPMPCPMCGVADLRLASIVVGIYQEAISERLGIPIRRMECWCPDCAPLVTGGWIRAAATEG